MGFLDFLFGGDEKNPADAAMPYLDQISGVGKQYLEPYIQPGMQAQQMAQSQYDAMSGDPMAYLNKLMEGYKPSQGYQYREKRLSDALGNTAAAGGYRGTKEDQIAQAELINALMGSDIQQYLQNVQGIQGRGLQGQENTINRGYGASNTLADYLGSALNAQAGLQLQGANAQNQARQANRQGLMKFLTPLIGAGVGFAAGGPPGAILGMSASQGGNVAGAFK